MRFNDLSDSDKLHIAQVHSNKTYKWDDRMQLLMNEYDVSERTVRNWISRLGLTKKKLPDSEEYRKAKLKKIDKQRKRYIITWAQNATPVNENFLENIEAYAKHIKAQILVVAGKYRVVNTSWSEYQDGDDYWQDSVSDYLVASTLQLHPYVEVLADLKILPTVTKPLTGLRGVDEDATCIIGHPKVHLESVPVLEGNMKKLLLTTGAVTIPNYNESKAGYISQGQHKYGFVVVEKDGNKFHVRQVTATEDGSFTDLVYEVENGGVSVTDTCLAFIPGDLHIRKADTSKLNAMGKLVENLQPKSFICHDLLDAESINHHEAKNPIKVFHKTKKGHHLVKREVDEAVEWLKELKETVKGEIVVVRSNHDDFLDRWIINGNWKKDLANADTYAKYLSILLADEDAMLLPEIIHEEEELQDVICLGLDASYKVAGFELGNHGDIGVNGSRGTINQFSRLGLKSITGHPHSPGRRNDTLCVGTSTVLRAGYNHGPSSWMHSDVIIHNNGQAQHIFYTDYKFTTLPYVKN